MKRVVVTVTGPAHAAEVVKREIAVALSAIGPFEVTAQGEFHNGDNGGNNPDPSRLELLLELAQDGVEVYVQRRR